MKLKPVDWIFVVYQLLLIVIIISYRNNISKIDYRYLIAGHSAVVLLVMFGVSRVQNTIIRNFYYFFILPFLYKEIGLLNHILIPYPKDEIFIRLDKMIFSGENIGLTFCKHFSSKMFSEIMHFFYFSYYLVTFLPALYILKKYPGEFDKYMFVVFLSFFLFYIIYIFYPVYGPEFYSNFIGEKVKPFKGWYFTKTLGFILGSGEINGAAFPSSHVGIALIIFLLVKNKNKIVAGLVFICFLGICLATVYCRAHYFVDIVAGIAVALVFYWVCAYIYDNLI